MKKAKKPAKVPTGTEFEILEAGEKRPGRPTAKAKDMPSARDKVIYLKIQNPSMSGPQIAAKVGLTHKQVKTILASDEAKARLTKVVENLDQKIANAHGELVQTAIKVMKDSLSGTKLKDKDIWLKFSAAKLILEPYMKKLATGAAGGDADEVIFEVIVQDDGTISQKVTKRKGGEDL